MSLIPSSPPFFVLIESHFHLPIRTLKSDSSPPVDAPDFEWFAFFGELKTCLFIVSFSLLSFSVACASYSSLPPLTRPNVPLSGPSLFPPVASFRLALFGAFKNVLFFSPSYPCSRLFSWRTEGFLFLELIYVLFAFLFPSGCSFHSFPFDKLPPTVTTVLSNTPFFFSLFSCVSSHRASPS